MTDKDDSVLGLHDLDKFECILWSYSPSLSQLFIRLFSSELGLDEHLYLGFRSVVFFSGPIKWVNANFRMGSRKEIEQLIDSGIKEIPDVMYSNFIDSLRLCVFEKPNFAIQILSQEDFQVIKTPLSPQH